MPRFNSSALSKAVIAANLLFAQPALSATDFFMTAEGIKQGKFHGDSKVKGSEDQINVVGFTYEVDSPRNITTGQASGKRQHKPIVITKDWGASSPQFLNALVTGEKLPQVILEMVTVDASGKKKLTYKITLKNAQVTGVQQVVTSSANGLLPTDMITLIYQSIEEEDTAANTTYFDEVINVP